MKLEELCELVDALVLQNVSWRTPEQQELMLQGRNKLQDRATILRRAAEITALEKRIAELKGVTND